MSRLVLVLTVHFISVSAYPLALEYPWLIDVYSLGLHCKCRMSGEGDESSGGKASEILESGLTV